MCIEIHATIRNMTVHGNVCKFKNEQITMNFASWIFKVWTLIYYKLCIFKYIPCLFRNISSIVMLTVQ